MQTQILTLFAVGSSDFRLLRKPSGVLESFWAARTYLHSPAFSSGAWGFSWGGGNRVNKAIGVSGSQHVQLIMGSPISPLYTTPPRFPPLNNVNLLIKA